MENSYLARKSGGGSAYNYELAPLIKNFSFYDFVQEGERKKYKAEDHGGFLIITNRQYIVGYNAGFGVGAHASAFARTMMDINGGGTMHTDADVFSKQSECKRNYITARIVYEYINDNINGRAIYQGYINFDLSHLGYKITPQQFECFKKFYNDHNDDIKYVANHNGFYVRFSYKDEKGNTQYNVSGSLDALYDYLSTIVYYDKTIHEEPIILGTTPDGKTLS